MRDDNDGWGQPGDMLTDAEVERARAALVEANARAMEVARRSGSGMHPRVAELRAQARARIAAGG